MDTKLRNKTATILDKDFQEHGTIKVDLQPYYQNFTYLPEKYSILMTHRVFCDLNVHINDEGYLLIDDKKYKIIQISLYTDHQLASCYECEVL